MRRRLVLVILALLVGVAVADPARIPFRPAARSGVVIVPDTHLRRWDPVTIFFPRSEGPDGGGPEDHPERHLREFPAHPGAFTWLDDRTLQFRPAEPWPPLSRLTWAAGGESVRLNTLMAPPLETSPADGADGLDPVESLTLTFADPLDLAVLTDMLRIELRPLPGLDPAQSRWLDREDFSIKALPRTSGDDTHRYQVSLKESIGLGTAARVHFSLAVDAAGEPGPSFAEVRFSTAEPFQARSLGCATHRYPLSAEGTTYSQPLDCGTDEAMVVVEFSAEPAPLNVLAVRELLRLSPPVENLDISLRGRRLEVRGDFARQTPYEVRLVPSPIVQDQRGRPLAMSAESSLTLHFPQSTPAVSLVAGAGIAERFGPQRVPLEGRGVERIDLRIHRIDPLDRGLWPFPDSPVTLNEDTRPPGPGEAPELTASPTRSPSVSELAAAVQSLGAPLISEVVPLPLSATSGQARFGLDLSAHLEAIAGKQAPGTYLVGVRSLSSTHRAWMRLQVTDLSLTTLEEPDGARLVVTSLASGLPVRGAQIRIEGALQAPGEAAVWAVLAEGRTDRDGAFTWQPPGEEDTAKTARRIVVQHGQDVLVLDPAHPPRQYTAGRWSSSSRTWLQWGFDDLTRRVPAPEVLCHLFTERPVYRPDHAVHIKGYIRQQQGGQLARIPGDVTLRVEGPADQSWSFPLSISSAGSIYQRFEEEDLPTGTYTASLDAAGAESCASVSFSMEDYAIPRFEVQLHTADTVPLDAPFTVDLTASYYAGGRVAARPVRWRVSQHPYTWQPPQPREGFLYSSDGRFSRTSRFTSSPRQELQATTDAQGQAELPLDPTVELTAQPRTYTVEATVTGDDDQTVTSTAQIIALPPHVLGLKVPRYLEDVAAIPVQILAARPDGSLIAGQPITVRLHQRQWHSHLQVGDFTDGAARYITDTVDVQISEQDLTSAAEPLAIDLPITEPGVYIVEIETHDRMGRASAVRVDLFASGPGAVSWSPPEEGVFSVTADADSYTPGQRATLTLHSPFQSAQALAVIEAPEGNRYQWLSVRDGVGALKVAVEGDWVPRVPVHVLLMRGRLDDAGTSGSEDLGRPTTLAASSFIAVDPVERRLTVELEHPAQALPGARFPITISMKDHQGRPAGGEVTLWMVDAAVLALGREQPLDPLPDFLRTVRALLKIRDTRSQAFGMLPYSENAGGDGGVEEEDTPFSRATVRRNFSPVPYYNPAISVPPTGRTTVTVELADSLSTFRLRARAVSGDDRFGYATGDLTVRLPLTVQPALPRFARPGDQLQATAIGRLIEGTDGEGVAQIQVTGAAVTGDTRQSVALQASQSAVIAFPLTVLQAERLGISVALERRSDGVSDAFAVELPIRPDADEVVSFSQHTLQPGESLTLPAPPPGARGIERTVVISDRPELLRAAEAAASLARYPYGGTEQRISRARAWLGVASLTEALDLPRRQTHAAIADTLAYLGQTLDEDGLVAFWPGSEGTVTLTAWAVHLLAEAQQAGYTVDTALLANLQSTLTAALRSDYRRLIDGEAWLERSWALSALAASGRLEESYFSELLRSAQLLDAEGLSQVLLAAARAGRVNTADTRLLVEELVGRVRLRQSGGEEVYDGLIGEMEGRSGAILPSEVRALASLIDALSVQQPDHPELPLLTEALIGLASEGGWGDPNADSAALRALSAQLHAAARPATVQLDDVLLTIGPDAPLARHRTTSSDPAALSVVSAAGPVLVSTTLRYTPGEPGSSLDPRSTGLVVSRQALLLQGDAPPVQRDLEDGGSLISVRVGDIIEEHVQLISPADRSHVALRIPLAAGLEPLNPRLATAPPEATPDGTTTAPASYTDWEDDQVALYFNELPKGTYDIYFRARATTEGRFTQPPASATMMYQPAVAGRSAGAVVEVTPL